MNKKLSLFFKPSMVNFCIIAFGSILNLLGKYIAVKLEAPLYLDSIGTVLCSCLLGPIAGCLAGLFGFFAFQLIQPTILFYALICIPVSFCVSTLIQKMTLLDSFQLVSIGILTALTSVFTTFILNFFFRQGYTGNLWGDALIAMFYQNGIESLFSHVAGHVFIELPDKVLTILIVFSGITLTGIIQKRRKGADAS